MSTPNTTESDEPQYNAFFINDCKNKNYGVNNSPSNQIQKQTPESCDDSYKGGVFFQGAERASSVERKIDDSQRPAETLLPNVDTAKYDRRTLTSDSKVDEEKPMQKADEDSEETSIHHDDEDIQRDAANDVVAFFVHVSLAFFALIFVCAIVGSMLIVASYGFITFVAIVLLVGIFTSAGYFVVRVVVDDKKLKPVRRQIRRWQAITKAVVIQEMRNFQQDMRDHQLLLTYDGGVTEYEDFDDLEPDTSTAQERQPEQNTYSRDNNEDQRSEQSPKRSKRRRGPRSMVFRVMVKPFLKEKESKRSWLRRKKKQSTALDSMVEETDEKYTNNSSYVPPVNEVA